MSSYSKAPKLQSSKAPKLQSSRALPFYFSKKCDPPPNHRLSLPTGWLISCLCLIVSTLLTCIPSQSIIAQENASCTANECNYTVPLDKAGFYIAVVTLPSGQEDGLWSLMVDPIAPVPYDGYYHGGGVLKENGALPSWVAFSLSRAEAATLTYQSFLGVTSPVNLSLEKEPRTGQRELVWGPTSVLPGKPYTIPTLEPGFYVANLFSQPNGARDFFSLSIGASSVFGGVSGGWLGSDTDLGFGAFYVNSPRKANLRLWFSSMYPGLGSAQPYLDVYFQNKDGTRELKWSSPVPTIPAETIQETPHLITTRVTDPKTDLSFIITNSSGKELTAIYGEKDSEGNLKSVTGITYLIKDTSSQDAPSQSVNLKLGNGITEPKFTIRFPNKDGKKKEVKVENYDPVKKTANLAFVEQDENGNETEVAKVEQQPLELPQESCLDNPLAVSFTDSSLQEMAKCAHTWSGHMINTIMGMFCDVAPGIITISAWYPSATGQASMCKPAGKIVDEGNAPSCITEPISNLNAAGSAFEFFLGIKTGNLDQSVMVLTDLIPFFIDRFTRGECKEEKSEGLKKPTGGKAASNGDPHLYTFDKLAYDFQAVGEFILVKSMVPNDSFEVQVRQQAWVNNKTVAINRAVAMNVAGDRVGFYLGQELIIRINGSPQNISVNSTYALPKGGNIINTDPLYSVVWPNGNGLVEITEGKTSTPKGHYFSVSPYISTTQKGQLIGLLGNADGNQENDLVARNGTTPLGIKPSFEALYRGDYANSWRIRQDESLDESLFDYAEGETTMTFTDREFPGSPFGIGDLDEITRKNAEAACEGIKDQALLNDCIFDFAVTGEKAFVDVTKGLDFRFNASNFVGCYRDESSRDLSEKAWSDGNMTIEKCLVFCEGFVYAGLEYSDECYCGNSYGKYGAATNCSSSCTGNSSQICGGEWANSVYEVPK